MSFLLGCVAIVFVSFKPGGASMKDTRGHWAKRSKKVGAAPLPPPAPTLFAPFCPMPSHVFRACPAWLKGNGNDCYAGYIFV